MKLLSLILWNKSFSLMSEDVPEVFSHLFNGQGWEPFFFAASAAARADQVGQAARSHMSSAARNFAGRTAATFIRRLGSTTARAAARRASRIFSSRNNQPSQYFPIHPYLKSSFVPKRKFKRQRKWRRGKRRTVRNRRK